MNKLRRDREIDPNERSLHDELVNAVSEGASGDILARIVTNSPFVKQLVWQFTVKKWAGPLYRFYDELLDEWQSVTFVIVWSNAKANGGRLVRKSVQTKNFGGYWNRVVSRKSLTARDRVFRDFNRRGKTGLELTDLADPAGDDPSLEAERNEWRLRMMEEAARRLPTELDRLVFRHLIDGTFDLRMIAASAGCCTQTVRRALARVRTLILSILDRE